MCFSAKLSSNIRPCRRAISKKSSSSSNCAGSKTAGRSALPKWPTMRSAWTSPKTSRELKNSCKNETARRGLRRAALFAKPGCELVLRLQDSCDGARRARVRVVGEEGKPGIHKINDKINLRGPREFHAHGAAVSVTAGAVAADGDRAAYRQIELRDKPGELKNVRRACEVQVRDLGLTDEVLLVNELPTLLVAQAAPI